MSQRIYGQSAYFAANPSQFCAATKTEMGRPRSTFQVLYESELDASEKATDRTTQEDSEMLAAAGSTARVATEAIFRLCNSPAKLRILRVGLNKAIPDALQILSIKVLEELPYLVRRLGASICQLP